MLDFPNAPTVGQKYPASPVAGVPTYAWDGEKWTTNGGATAVGAPPSNTVPLMDGAGAAGTSLNYTRSDHRHPTDTTRAAATAPVFTGGITTDSITGTGSAQFASMTITGNETVGGNTTVTGAVKAGTLNIGNSALAATAVIHPAANENLTVTNNSGVLLISALNDAGVAAPMQLSSSALAILGAASFNTSPTAPTPTVGDNSTKVATTAFVLANTSTGSYLPISGGTLTGALVVNAAITTTVGNITTQGWSGNLATGLIFFGNSGAKYIYFDGTSFTMTAVINASNGRLWGASDALPVPGGAVSNGRLAYAGDTGAYPALQEPYGGAVMTGYQSDNATTGVVQFRWRYMQLYTTGWFTIGYA